MRMIIFALLLAISYAQTDFLTLEAYINKDETSFTPICQSIATAFEGVVLECDLEHTGERRILQEGESILLNIVVPDAHVVLDTLESDDYSIEGVLGLRMPSYSSMTTRRNLHSPHLNNNNARCQSWCLSSAPQAYCDWVNCGKCTRCFPTRSPTKCPTDGPTINPTKAPTNVPSTNPTKEPTKNPTTNPTKEPTINPTKEPTKNPTTNPTKEPTVYPTRQPTSDPLVPSSHPTNCPSMNPTLAPSDTPTINPTNNPSTHPTVDPTSGECETWCPGRRNSWYDACGATPGKAAFWKCSGCPECDQLTDQPTREPSLIPTRSPTSDPTEPQPSNMPTMDPTMHPTKFCKCNWWCSNIDSNNPNRSPTPWAQRCNWTGCCGCRQCFSCSAHSDCQVGTYTDDMNRVFCHKRGGGYCDMCDACEECSDGIDGTCGSKCGTTTEGKTCP